jgi:hypothetical protein
MKYHCVHCDITIKYPENRFLFLSEDSGMGRCVSCGMDTMKPISDYETPAEYEARTGKKLSASAHVWVRCKTNHDVHSIRYRNLRDGKAFIGCLWCDVDAVLIGCPEPPPDDWKGE